MELLYLVAVGSMWQQTLQLTGLTKRSTSAWGASCRQLVVQMVLQKQDNMIGGPGRVVQIDESPNLVVISTIEVIG